MIVVTNQIGCSSIQTREANRDGDFDRASRRSFYTILCNAFALIGVGVGSVIIVIMAFYPLLNRSNSYS